VQLSASQEFVYTRTYARWLPKLGRRERWEETVDRYVSFLEEERGALIPKKVLRKIGEGVLGMRVMPSMRLLWAAGDAARADNVTAYNCAFAEIDAINSFSECLYILMCGAGYGFSVTGESVSKLPVVPTLTGESLGTYTVEDSRGGWAESVKQLMTALYAGKDIDINYGLLRPRGARLHTMGGRSSGPAPLIQLHGYIREVFERAQGRRLKTIECHDICNQIAEIVVVGGVRRSSQISLSDLQDEDMRWAKEHPFPLRRTMANNSAIYTERPSAVDFLREWGSLAGSGTGERGIFNLEAAQACSPDRRDSKRIRGVNPCAEILLRAKQFCNLSEIVVRADDDLDSLLEKVETATWIGAIQSTFTEFPYLGPTWKRNCDEERLLGISITGQMDNPGILTSDALRALKARALKVAKHAATKLGTNMSAAVTCVKPSGTVSQLVDSSSGLHPRYANTYLRRYRVAAIDPVVGLLQSQGFPLSPETGQRKEDWEAARRLHRQGKPFANTCTIFNKGDWSPEAVMTWVATFPQAAPAGARTRDQMSALDQLEWYKHIQTNWCEHNASCSVYVRDEEWFEVGNWVYKNWGVVNGVSFLPYEGGHYEQMPYEEITSDQYKSVCETTPRIDFQKLSEFEKEDLGTGASTAACVGGACEL
jgi:ribonucleoside-triphosphate reductase (thioredoxin)